MCIITHVNIVRILIQIWVRTKISNSHLNTLSKKQDSQSQSHTHIQEMQSFSKPTSVPPKCACVPTCYRGNTITLLLLRALLSVVVKDSTKENTKEHNLGPGQWAYGWGGHLGHAPTKNTLQWHKYIVCTCNTHKNTTTLLTTYYTTSTLTNQY